MKLPRDFHAKRQMTSVARPIIDVFLYDKSPEKREKILRVAVRNTSEDSRLVDQKIVGECNYLTGKIRVAPNATPGTCSHELAHSLRKYLRNDSRLANSLSSYMDVLPLLLDEKANPDTVNQLRMAYAMKGMTQSTLYLYDVISGRRKSGRIRDFIYSTEYVAGHSCTGDSFGLRAALIEHECKLPGSGLFYLRELDLGISSSVAETRVVSKKVFGIYEFLEKYGESWKKIVGGKIK